jgi:hypothetical protein
MRDWPGQGKNQWIWKRRWNAYFRYWYWHDQAAGGQGGNRNKPKNNQRKRTFA